MPRQEKIGVGENSVSPYDKPTDCSNPTPGYALPDHRNASVAVKATKTIPQSLQVFANSAYQRRMERCGNGCQ
jgi:hypothetical protein